MPFSLDGSAGLLNVEDLVKLGHSFFHSLVYYLGYKFSVASFDQKLKMNSSLRIECLETWDSTFRASKSEDHLLDSRDQREDSIASHLSVPFKDAHRDGRMMVNVIQKYKRIKIPEFSGLTEKELRLYHIPATKDPRPEKWAVDLRSSPQTKPAAAAGRKAPAPSTTELDLFYRQSKVESFRVPVKLSVDVRPTRSSKLDPLQRTGFGDRSRDKGFRVCRRSPDKTAGFSLLEDSSCHQQTDTALAQSSLFSSNRLLKRDGRRLVSIGTKVVLGLGPLKLPPAARKPPANQQARHKSPPPYSDSLKVRKLKMARVEFLLTSLSNKANRPKKRP